MTIPVYNIIPVNFLRRAIDTDASFRCQLTFSLSEMLEPDLRKRVETDFDSRIIDLYGSTEFTSIAWKCKETSQYHLDIDAVVEPMKLDSDSAANDGEPARIVATGLLNRAMPLIRYTVGDIGIFTDEECSCGIKLPLMKRIEGRQVDCIRLPSGV